MLSHHWHENTTRARASKPEPTFFAYGLIQNPHASCRHHLKSSCSQTTDADCSAYAAQNAHASDLRSEQCLLWEEGGPAEEEKKREWQVKTNDPCAEADEECLLVANILSGLATHSVSFIDVTGQSRERERGGTRMHTHTDGQQQQLAQAWAPFACHMGTSCRFTSHSRHGLACHQGKAHKTQLKEQRQLQRRSMSTYGKQQSHDLPISFASHTRGPLHTQE
jgi:hypothetical protein